MSSDLQQLTDLFDAKVQSFEGPTERRFQVLLPFKQGIIRLREKNASSRTIAELLKQLGITVSHNTIARFCRELAVAATTPVVHSRENRRSLRRIGNGFSPRLAGRGCECRAVERTRAAPE